MRLQKHISVPNAETWARVQARAEEAGVSVSEYLLTCALADDGAAQARADLQRLAGELGVLAMAAGKGARGQSAAEYLDALEAE